VSDDIQALKILQCSIPEKVLILLGRGSLGAFGCGVFKAVANSNIKIDVVAGTLIGGLNASIIAGSREHKFEIPWLTCSSFSQDLDRECKKWY
jgi:NTE family protein